MLAKQNHADVAHLVERHLAKVEVASSSLVIRSIFYRGHGWLSAVLFCPASLYAGKNEVLAPEETTAGMDHTSCCFIAGLFFYPAGK